MAVVSPFSACSGPAECVCVCVSGLWLNGVRSVFCRAASPVSFISTDFYHYENKILHRLLAPPLGLLQPFFLNIDAFFFFFRKENKQKQKTKPAEENKSCGRYEFAVQDRMRPERISAFKIVIFFQTKRNRMYTEK